jgi:hypothetical protein
MTKRDGRANDRRGRLGKPRGAGGVEGRHPQRSGSANSRLLIAGRAGFAHGRLRLSAGPSGGLGFDASRYLGGNRAGVVFGGVGLLGELLQVRGPISRDRI